MRALYQLTGVTAVVVFVLGVKAVIPTPVADAAINPGINVLQMQATAAALPQQAIHDMTFALD